MRRALYPEALVSVTRSINGYGSNSGYRSDFRSHFLLGTIRLGSLKNSSPQIIDLKHAEDAFVAAARYAEVDFPDEQGKALICAGRAARLQGKIDPAIRYTQSGLNLLPSDVEGQFQLAQLLFDKTMFQDASDALVKALCLNAEIAIRAAADARFLTNREFLNKALKRAHAKYKERYKSLVTSIDQGLKRAEKFSFGGLDAQSLIAEHLSRFRAGRRDVKRLAEANTIIGQDNAIKKIITLSSQLPNLFEEFRARFVQQQERLLAKVPVANAPEGGTDVASTAGALIGSSITIIVFGSIALFVLMILLGIAGVLFNSKSLEDAANWLAVQDRFKMVIAIAVVVGVIIILFAIRDALRYQFGRNRHLSDLQWRSRLRGEISQMQGMPCPKEWLVSS